MVAIIKKNFRLQNARDFLDNLKSHPRADLNGNPTPLETSSSLTITAQPISTDTASAAYTWSWDVSNTLSASDKTNTAALKKDAIVGLKKKIGAHVADRNHYLFIGKTTPWTQTDDLATIQPVAELSPAPPDDTLNEERRVWDEMLGLKRIGELQGSLVVPRYDWDGTGKTVYRVYDDKNPNLYNEPSVEEKISANVPRGLDLKLGSFYVINSEYDLFVCIETGLDANGDPNPSTEEPRRTQSPKELIDYSDIDGYVWKYITTIKSSDVNKFTTDHWIPVKTLTAQEVKESELEELAGGIPEAQAIVQKYSTPGSVVSCIIENPKQQLGTYQTTHTGVLVSAINPASASSHSTGVLAKNPLISGATDPSSSNNAYNNMHLYVYYTTTGASPVSVTETYVIDLNNGYNGSTKTISLASTESWSTSLLAALAASQTVTYEILPIIVAISNGTTPVKIKPVVSNGMISRVKVIDPGEGATFVNVLVNASSGKSSVSAVPAKVRAVISPIQGLGSDPEKDLGAYFVMLTAKLPYNDGSNDFPVSNDYRQIGIIRDLRDSDGNLATSSTYNAANSLTLSNISGDLFAVDEIIKQSYVISGQTVTAKAILIDITQTGVSQHRIGYVQTPETGYVPFVTGQTLSTERYGTDGTILSSQVTADVVDVISPEIKKFTGEILYLENRRAILRSSEQTEDIKAIIEF